jgi:hypothetical protein
VKKIDRFKSIITIYDRMEIISIQLILVEFDFCPLRLERQDSGHLAAVTGPGPGP